MKRENTKLMAISLFILALSLIAIAQTIKP
jgi:hypothetical protein